MSRTSFEGSLQLECPICFELPKSEVYQCNNGHPVCSKCYEKLSECPMCRVPFGEERKRCFGIESILDTKSFPCPFKDQGCHLALKRGLLIDHELVCKYSYRIQEYCKMLGFNCNYKSNLLDIHGIIAHFQKHHNASVVEQKDCQLKLLDFGQACNSSHLFWTPVILQIGKQKEAFNNYFVFEAYCEDDSLKLASIFVQDPLKDVPTNFRALIEITDPSGQMPVIKMDILPDAFSAAARLGSLAMWPITIVPLSLLKSNYISTNDEISLSIKVDFSADLSEDLKDIKLDTQPIFLSPKERSIKSRTISHNCNECEALEVKTARYKCLQCDDYDLCETCFSKDIHSHHFFALCKTNGQKDYIFMVSLASSSDYKKILEVECEERDMSNFPVTTVNFFPTTCIGCGVFPIPKVFYVCLLCPLADICEECVNAGFHRQHIFGIVRNKRVEKFYQLERAKSSSIIPCWSGTLNLK